MSTKLSLLDTVLRACGHKQTWYVCWSGHTPDGKIISADGTVLIQPRLSVRCFEELRGRLAEEILRITGYKIAVSDIHITYLTRIGS